MGTRHLEFQKEEIGFYPRSLEDAIMNCNRELFSIRNRNLFYVCCSRAKKRLAVFITFPVNGAFKAYLENTFGVENIMTYGEFMRIEA